MNKYIGTCVMTCFRNHMGMMEAHVTLAGYHVDSHFGYLFGSITFFNTTLQFIHLGLPGHNSHFDKAAESIHPVVIDALVQASPGPSCSMTSLVATKPH